MVSPGTMPKIKRLWRIHAVLAAIHWDRRRDSGNQHFRACTGIRGTPTTIVTKENRVRLVYAGLFSDSIRNQIFSGGLLEPSARVRFPSPGLEEAIVQ